jgi:hypothetical protein
MKWVDEIINAVEVLGGVAQYSDIYEYIEANTTRNLSEHWQASVRAIIEDHSSDAQFRTGVDLFYSASGIGNGVWGLRSKIMPSPVAVDIVDPEPPIKNKLEVYRVLRDTFLCRQLKQLYNYSCQICGKTINIGDSLYAEAHHIQPLGGPHHGPDISENIIITCPNHHVEFDYGVIAINTISMKTIHKNKSDQYHDKRINLKAGHSLGLNYLQYHLEKIFNK